ncbi:uncharacterized protein LOC108627321 [Ceratina calcarata]|uniref:Uncharacterized protein LOC108627321 n=1 Tax=Ceratina calcarata TaxID=156304 RepID=A0AAJ7J428_9HYME|nr:uncharacterized protein LOC108627321 [Ceratina calcarata]
MANVKLLTLFMLFAFVGTFASSSAEELRSHVSLEEIRQPPYLVKRAADDGPGEVAPGGGSGESGEDTNNVAEIQNIIKKVTTIIGNVLSLNNVDKIPAQLQDILSSVQSILNTLTISNLISLLVNNVDTLKMIPVLGSVISTAQLVIKVVSSVYRNVYPIIKVLLGSVTSLLPVPL